LPNRFSTANSLLSPLLVQVRQLIQPQSIDTTREKERSMSTVCDHIQCPQCKHYAYTEFQTRDNSTDTRCANCGFTEYSGPKFDDKGVVVKDWVHEVIPGAGVLHLQLADNICSQTSFLSKAETTDFAELEKMLRADVASGVLSQAVLARWNAETQVVDVLYEHMPEGASFRAEAKAMAAADLEDATQCYELQPATAT
jgi:predicted RNA-binding Zn-ribbon protein involved in translation (DUF1610 family)